MFPQISIHATVFLLSGLFEEHDQNNLIFMYFLMGLMT